MKRILCYGDSNTWGYVPSGEGERYPRSICYPKVLASILGEEYEVIEEGLPGRTVIADNIKEFIGNRNGSTYFTQAVYSHLPLDYILIMLGTNDLKESYNLTVKDLSKALEEYYIKPILAKLNGKIKNDPKIIVVAPAVISKEAYDEFIHAYDKSIHFNEEYEALATKYNLLFVDNTGLVNGSDYIHLTSDSHLLLARKIAETIINN